MDLLSGYISRNISEPKNCAKYMLIHKIVRFWGQITKIVYLHEDLA